MKTHLRKFMAVLCTLSVLLSCMAVAGFSVSAATVTMTSGSMSSDYNAAAGVTAYSLSGSAYNIMKNGMSAYPTILQEGAAYPADEAHGHAMRLAFEAGGTSLVSGNGNRVAGFRINNQNAPADDTRLQYQHFYRVSFEYKVKEIPADLERPITLDTVLGTFDWGSVDASYFGNGTNLAPNVFHSIALTATTSEWQTCSFTMRHEGLSVNYALPLNIVLSPNGNGNAAAGTTVLVDNVNVEYKGSGSATAGSAYVVANNIRPGTTDTRTIRPVLGDTLPYVIADYSTDKEFDGWYANSALTTQKTTYNDTDISNLYIKWKDVVKKYTFSYDLNGGTAAQGAVLTQTDVAGTDVIAPPTVTRDGYTFAGWQVDGADWTYEAGVTKVPAKDTVVTAVWTEDTPEGSAPEGSAPEGPAPEGPAPEGPAEEQDKDEPAAKDEASSSTAEKAPLFGNTTNMAFWLVLLLVSCAALVTMFVVSKKGNAKA